ncbi:MAG: hypothetical protein LQ345_003918 [Seirophora villosa]|nr:MAG: hypothetical protein LQ345_003918 [Seirophora villosa]
MKGTTYLWLSFLIIGFVSAAVPAAPENGVKAKSVDDDEAWRRLSTPSTLPTTLTTNHKINYPIPSSLLILSLVYMPHRPIERSALGHTLQRAQASRRAYLATHPDTWVAPADDPFRIDYLRTGKCAVRIESLKPGGPGTERMTYGGVLDVLRGLWEVLFMGKREFESVFEVRNGSAVVGFGTVLVGNVPHFSEAGGVVGEE